MLLNINFEVKKAKTWLPPDDKNRNKARNFDRKFIRNRIIMIKRQVLLVYEKAFQFLNLNYKFVS